MAAPNEVIAGRQLHLLGNDALRFLYVPPHIPAGHIDIDEAGGKALFVFNHGWPGSEGDVGDLGDWNLRPIRRGDQHSIQTGYIAAEVT